MRHVPSACYGLLISILTATAAQAQAPASLAPADREAIQTLVDSYASALGECRAEDFADLFVPETGYFASGFRGRMVGRDELIALVRSERHCRATAGAAPAARPGGNGGPTVDVDVVAGHVRGIANLGTAEYQDEYVQTPSGWRFGSRTVIIAAEKAAGLDADALLAIDRLGGPERGNYYETDENGVRQLMTSGVRVSVSGADVTGRVFLADGGFRDEVYAQVGGTWLVQSSKHSPPEPQ